MPQKHAINLNNLPLWKTGDSAPFRAKDRADAILYAKHCGYDEQSLEPAPADALHPQRRGSLALDK